MTEKLRYTVKSRTKLDIDDIVAYIREGRAYLAALFGNVDVEPANIEIFGNQNWPYKSETVGCYDKSSRKIEILYKENKEDFFNTLVHEMNHQILFDLSKNTPKWMSEGMAGYHSIKQGKIVYGEAKDYELGLVKEAASKGKMVRLEDLVRSRICFEDERKFLAYAEAWSFVFFLIKTNRMPRYFNKMKAGNTNCPTTDEIKILEPVWADYLDRLITSLPC